MTEPIADKCGVDWLVLKGQFVQISELPISSLLTLDRNQNAMKPGNGKKIGDFEFLGDISLKLEKLGWDISA